MVAIDVVAPVDDGSVDVPNGSVGAAHGSGGTIPRRYRTRTSLLGGWSGMNSGHLKIDGRSPEVIVQCWALVQSAWWWKPLPRARVGKLEEVDLVSFRAG